MKFPNFQKKKEEGNFQSVTSEEDHELKIKEKNVNKGY